MLVVSGRERMSFYRKGGKRNGTRSWKWFDDSKGYMALLRVEREVTLLFTTRQFRATALKVLLRATG
jgi:hypothetical protein